MKRSVKLASLLLVLTLLSSPAFAFDNFQQSSWVKETAGKPYSEKIINKLGFGILNFGTGWTAILYEPYHYSNKFTGLLKGGWRFITNTVGGVLHIATFPFPFDIPLPDGGVNFDR